jgi:predicted ABC-type ATPase
VKAVAERGSTVLVQLDDEQVGRAPFDQTRGVVVDRRRNTVSMPAFVESILQRGYWVPFTGDPEPVLSLVSSALTAAGFDESKHPRHPKGDERGGEFAAKTSPVREALAKLADSDLLEKAKDESLPVRERDGYLRELERRSTAPVELVGTPSWLKEEAKTAEDGYYKATRPREAVAIARGWLAESGFTEEAQGNAVQVVDAMNQHYPDGWEFFLSINDLHKEDFRRNYMKSGEYIPEREALHNGIRAAYLSTAQLPPPGEKPEALFLAGGSGAGKSSILGNQEQDGNFHGGTIDAPKGAVYVNPDEIKELLPESDALRKIDDPRWAALSHEESSDIAARLRKDAEQAGFPMVIDGTGDAEGPSERFPEGKFMGKVRDAENAGYKTKIVFVDIPTEEAVSRARVRAETTGRKVSEETIRDIHRNVTARHLEWRDTAADWEVWANDDADQGGRRLIARRVAGGPIEILDRARYAQMEAKAR